MTNKTVIKKPNYGNWVSRKIIFLPLFLGVVIGISAIWIHWLFVLSSFFFLIGIYFFLARWYFSDSGKNIQDQVQDLVIDHLNWDGKGKILDIGCGNGALSIKLAKKYAGAQVTGIDSWGKEWEYGKQTCEENAHIEGVSGQTRFKKTRAASLTFENDSFDAVVSNLVFHEVKEEKDKCLLIKEALRVVKKGGCFTFQDLFLWKAIYGDRKELIIKIKGWGINSVKFEDTSRSRFIPAFLKLPFMLGTIGIIYGKK